MIYKSVKTFLLTAAQEKLKLIDASKINPDKNGKETIVIMN